MENAYTVKTSHFEGPLDLLLSLIEKRKLLINEISLGQIADDYVAYVETLKDFPMRETANFILIASTLVLIKSKSLIPALNLSLEEEQDIGELEYRLKLYKKFKEISREIENKFGKKIIFEREDGGEFEAVFSPPEGLDIKTLEGSLLELLKSLPVPEKTPEAIVKKVISLEEMMDNLQERVEKAFRMSFKNFAGKEDKINVIVGFLAILELVKQGVVAVKQEQNFSDIEIEKTSTGIPNYSK